MQNDLLSTDIRDKIWNGSVNIVIEGADRDSRIDGRRYLVSLPRNAYFPLHFEDLLNFFAQYDQGIKKRPIWLEYERNALKWNHPVGVLYDFYCLKDKEGTSDSTWHLCLKLRGSFPSELIIPFSYRLEDGEIDYEKTTRQIIVSQLKQSCFVYNGNSKPVMKLSEDDYKSLWLSIKNNNLDQFTSINDKIIPSNRKLLRVPIRVLLMEKSTYIQNPIYPFDANGRPLNLLEVLRKSVPPIFDEEGKLIASAFIHGIHVDNLLSLDIVQIWSLFKHLDNFLYIIILYQF